MVVTSSFKIAEHIVEDHRRPIYSVSFFDHPLIERPIFASVGSNRATVYEIGDDNRSDVVHAFADEDNEESFYTSGWTVDLSTMSPLLAVAGLRGIVKILNVGNNTVYLVLFGHGNAINELRFHHIDPNLLLTASKDESIRLWNIQTNVCVAIFSGYQGHRDEVLGLDVHMQGTQFVSCGMDNQIKLWDLSSEKVQHAIESSYVNPKPSLCKPFNTIQEQFPIFSSRKVHSDYVDCVRFVGDLIASKSTRNRIILWKPDGDRKQGSVMVLKEYLFTDGEIWFIKFGLDPDMTRLAVGNRSGRVYLWAVDGPGTAGSASKLQHIKCGSTVRQTAFSPCGRHLVLSCDDGTIWRWKNHAAGSASASASVGTEGRKVS